MPRTRFPLRTFAVATALFTGAYLVWRAGWTLNGGALWLALPLLVAEVHGYLTFLGYLFMTWDCRAPKQPLPLPGASVDFFIPTYNEPFAVLAPTIAGAVAIEYPHRTYVLDDGRRLWVERLCRQMGAEYLTRPDNLGAKAGNLNYALSQTSGEFVGVVDADFVPSPRFIDDLIGYFRDPKLAFVQGPQEFYNLDSFQHLEGDPQGWHEQTIFFRTIQLGKNRWNAAFWCGCPSMLRRSAIASVGGVSTETITEDLHTSLRLHAKGWRSVYHPGLIALGIAPNDYEGFIVQRLRWAEGTMQVIRREWRIKGLSLAQRLNYIASTGTYFDAIRKAVFLTIVPLVLLTDQLPIRASAGVFLPVWAAQFLLGSIANSRLARGSNRVLMTEFFDLLKLFAFIKASWTLISGKRARFRVTPKGLTGERKLRGLLAPYAALLGLYVLSMGVGVARLTDFGLGTANPTALFAAVLWAGAIVSILGMVTSYGYRKVSRRQADRVSMALAGSYQTEYGTRDHAILLEDLTTAGCAFLAPVPPAIGKTLRVSVDGAGLTFRAIVKSVRRRDDGFVVGLAVDASERTQARLAALVARGIFTREVAENDGARLAA